MIIHFRVAPYALADVLHAMALCDYHDVAVSKSDDELVVGFTFKRKFSNPVTDSKDCTKSTIELTEEEKAQIVKEISVRG